MNKALLSSKNMCWCTPQDFFDKLNEEFSFTLDAADTDKTAKCPLYFTPETRRKNIYAQEMTTEQHIQLLEALRAHSGSVVLSGYANEIYDNMLHDWKRIEKRALAERGQTRTEILWIKNAKGGEEP